MLLIIIIIIIITIRLLLYQYINTSTYLAHIGYVYWIKCSLFFELSRVEHSTGWGRIRFRKQPTQIQLQIGFETHNPEVSTPALYRPRHRKALTAPRSNWVLHYLKTLAPDGHLSLSADVVGEQEIVLVFCVIFRVYGVAEGDPVAVKRRRWSVDIVLGDDANLELAFVVQVVLPSAKYSLLRLQDHLQSTVVAEHGWIVATETRAG